MYSVVTMYTFPWIFFCHNVFWAQLYLTSAFNDKIGKLVKKYMEEEGKRLDGEVEERVRAVLRIADKNEDDKIVFQGDLDRSIGSMKNISIQWMS